VEVDLEGVEFFSLTGATGSGKSSLVDAMIFALFGRVPRLGGNAVAPAISAGAVRARVAVDFEVDGDIYTAVRMAERTKSGGATVKEARLQKGDKVLADGADDVTREVEDLLSLRFDDFTRTVVLPQGEFARFLTSPKAERQALLRNLLGLDIYSTVRSLAKTRESVAGDRAEVARRQADAIELVDQQTLKDSHDRLEALKAIAATVVDEEKALAQLDSECEEARKSVGRITESLERLAEITLPDRIEELDQLVVEARDGLDGAEARYEEVSKSTRELEAKMADSPSLDEINGLRKSRLRQGEIEERLANQDSDSALKRLGKAESSLEIASEHLDAIRTRLTAAHVSHAAHALTAALEVGEPCPVCSQVVASVPTGDASTAVSALEEKEVLADRAVKTARSEFDEASAVVTQMETSVSGLKTQLAEANAEIRGAPPLDELDRLEQGVLEGTVELESSRSELEATEIARREVRSKLEDLAESVRRLAKDLTAAQLRVADLEPPVPESDDVLVQWKELLVWRDETSGRLTSERPEVEADVSQIERRARARRDDLVTRLESLSVALIEPFAVQVALETEMARRKVADIEKAEQDRAALEKKIKESESEAEIAAGLANHLKANGFERWLMVGAIADLVEGANGLLAQLSDGGYSLHSDDSGTFSIIDHRNADEKRSVSTLSGGETFLVSLALALSLAETLAAAGGADLDTIILDEGFGALDDESLDTVAAVLEELAGKGLVVGVITHVKELASRAPVRFEVTRDPTGAKVVKVS
jgi:exonuclease SbcC